MSERRHAAAARAALEAFPSTDQLEDAWRNTHNLAAAFQGLQVLGSVLEVTRDARQQYEAILEATAQAQADQEAAQEALAAVQAQHQTMAAEFQRQREQALAAHQEYLGALQAEAMALEAPLQQQRDALRETRQQAEQLKATMLGEAQRLAQAEKAQAMTEVVRLRQEKQHMQADIDRMTTQRDQLTADLAAALHKLSEVGA